MSGPRPIASYPLASLQGAMLVNHLRAPHSGVDVLQVVSALDEPVDVAALRTAWELVTAHHDVLRTTFVWEDVAEPRQSVFAEAPMPVAVHDWSACDAATADSSWRALMAQDRLHSFDLRALPLQRVTLVRLGERSWRMLWTFHHILMDGRSFAMVLREVFDAYDAICSRAPWSPAERRPYRDFVAWYTAQRFSDAEPIWRDRLRGVAGPTPLPGSFHDSADARGRGLRERMLDAGCTAALASLARTNDVTMNTVVQAAWALLLSRHSGEEDVVFGATRACRKGTIAGADAMVGLFINTLPLRVHVPPDQPLSAMLQELRRNWRSTFEVEHTPIQLVQKWSDIAAATPLFESHVVFENQSLDQMMATPGSRATTRRSRWFGATNFALTVLAYGGETLSLEIDYDGARIDEGTADRLLDHLATLLRSMAANPAARIGEVSMLPATERERVVLGWNDTFVAYPATTLVELLGKQAALTPDAIAVEDERRALTFAQLDAAAASLALCLRTMGVERNVLVGICAERSVELVVGLVAILKAGGAYVPLDPEYPRERLTFMLEDAAVRVLLVDSAASTTLLAGVTPVVSLAGVADPPPAPASGGQLPVPDPDDAAYMIYTSGSTGRPKGALNGHRGIVNRLLWMQSEYRLGSGDVVLQKTPFSFDVSVWEFFWPLLAGATLVMARPGGHRDTAYLVDVITKRGVTVCHFVPSMLRAFLADSGAGRCTSLRDVMASGEALAPDLVAAFYRTFPRTCLHNLYGPTECAVDVTYWACPRSVAAPSVVPIGRPVANTRMYVLDARGGPTPIGVPGELYIGGAQVGLGYQKRPELTAERFVTDPFSEIPNARMYRTGDKARWRPDGTIEYLGRLDFQVKIRGFRIELGEIEACLVKHPRVRDAVVVAREDGGAERRLVAYVVADGETPSIAALREHVRETLPEYMVPAAFKWLPALPLSTNGKVDRRALPATELERETLSQPYVAPRTDVERALSDIWAQVLRLEKVGIEDNFFELGGDSLLSVQVLARANAAGLGITLTQVMRQPTVAGLARVARQMTETNAPQHAEVVGPVPLTPVQHWFFELQGNDPGHWNQAFLFKMASALDASALEAAASAVVQHHDSLRLRFERSTGGWQQWCVPRDLQPVIEAIDLTDLPEDARPNAIAAACSSMQASLDLGVGPLIRLGLFDQGAGRPALLFIAVHHLAIDAVSWRILREDLETAYSQCVRGDPMALPRRTVPFSAWATRLVAPAARQALRSELDYWEQAGSPASLRLPRDIEAQGPDYASDTDTLTLRLSEGETQALLQAVPKAYNTRVNDALLSALGDALESVMGRGEVVVNLEGHGREDVVSGTDVSRTLGWFTTLFPVRLRLGATDVAGRLKETKEILRAVPQRGIGYGMLRYLGGAETLRAQTTPEIAFNYMGQFDQVVAGSKTFGFAAEASGSWYGAQTRRPHLLEINCLVIGGTLELRWSFSSRAHFRATIARLAEAYMRALRGVIAHCTTPGVTGCTPSDFPLARLDQATLDRIVANQRDVEDVYPVVPMQRLFLSFADSAADPGFEQWRYRLRGIVDLAALRRAWELVLSRHSILRTAFVSDGLDEPLQVVSRGATLPWAEHDWRHLAKDEQRRRMAEFLDADRVTGFTYDRAPLMRITVVRVTDDTYEFVWSKHHLLLDRWSWRLLLLEVRRAYPALAADRVPAFDPPVRYHEFVAWQHGQSQDSARRYWTRHLAKFEAPPRLPILRPDATQEAEEVSVALGIRETDAVRALARAHRIAANTVIAGAWALWLARCNRHNDVSLGLSVAGRGDGVRGIEGMVGLTINNLPLRVVVDGATELGPWLRELHDAQAEMQQYAYTPLDRVQEWSGVPWRIRLFETLLVFQHDDADVVTSAWLGDDVAMEPVHVPTRTAYPLSMIVAGTDAIELRATFDPRYFDADSARGMVEGLRRTLVAMVDAPNARVEQILGALPEASIAVSGVAQVKEYIAPHSATEAVLAGLWSELLGIERVGVTDDFFALGGYSLVATQIASRVRATLQLDMPVRLLFRHRTVRGLAEALRSRERSAGQLERIAELVQRVNAMSLDELRNARAVRAGIN